jgi:hypothetical protein
MSARAWAWATLTALPASEAASSAIPQNMAPGYWAAALVSHTYSIRGDGPEHAGQDVENVGISDENRGTLCIDACDVSEADPGVEKTSPAVDDREARPIGSENRHVVEYIVPVVVTRAGGIHVDPEIPEVGQENTCPSKD